MQDRVFVVWFSLLLKKKKKVTKTKQFYSSQEPFGLFLIRSLNQTKYFLIDAISSVYSFFMI